MVRKARSSLNFAKVSMSMIETQSCDDNAEIAEMRKKGAGPRSTSQSESCDSGSKCYQRST